MATEPKSLGRHGAKLVLEYIGIGRVLRSDEIRDDSEGRAYRIAEAAELRMRKWTKTEADLTGDPETAAENREGELNDYKVRDFQRKVRVREIVKTNVL